MNGKTVNKSISFLFSDRFWLSSKQWIDFLNNSSYIKPGQCTLRSLNFSPFAALSIFSLFFFRFHFQGLNILPMEENLLFLSGGGVCCVVVLSVADFISPFFFLSEKKKIKHSQQSISVCHNFPADVIFYTVPDCNSKSIPCVGKWPANANSGFNNQGTML